jgi:hypothetical protein
MRERIRQLQAFDRIRFAQKANSNITYSVYCARWMSSLMPSRSAK